MAGNKKDYSIEDLEAEFDSLPDVRELEAEFEALAAKQEVPAKTAEPEPASYEPDIPYLRKWPVPLEKPVYAEPEKPKKYGDGDKYSVRNFTPEEGPSSTPEQDQAQFAFATGASKGASLGFNDEIAAALRTVWEAGRRAGQSMGLAGPDGGSVMAPEDYVDPERPSLGEYYTNERDILRQWMEDMRAGNPKSFFAGEVAGAVALPTPKVKAFGPSTTMAGGIKGALGNAANAGLSAAPMGAAAGLGNSKESTVGGMLEDTAIGGTIGLGAGAGANLAGQGLRVGGQWLAGKAEEQAFKELSGKSLQEAGEETGARAAARFGKQGLDAEAAPLAQDAARANREVARQALDSGIVGGSDATMRKTAEKISNKAADEVRQIANAIDDAVGPSYRLADDIAADAMESTKPLLQAPTAEVRRQNRTIIKLVKDVINDLTPPIPAQRELFEEGTEQTGRMTLRNAWEVVMSLRQKALAQKDEVGRRVLNDLADNIEIDLMQHTQDIIATGTNQGAIGPLLSEALDKTAAKSTAATNASKLLASKAASKADDTGLLSDLMPDSAKAMSRLGTRVGTGLSKAEDGASKLSDYLGKAVSKNAAKIGQTAAIVQPSAPTWENIKQRLSTNPQSLGPYAKSLAEAAARGDKNLAITHYLLSQRDPRYQELMKNSEE